MRKKLVVEARNDGNVTPIMDSIVDVSSALGHEVVRWRGPIAGSRNYSRSIPRCDLAIFFNGTHRKYDRYHARLTRQGTPVLYVELGWFPQKGTLQIDPAGINDSASWTRQPLTAAGSPDLDVKRNGDLLLLLQIDRDTQITHHSPWFANMFEFVSHVAQFSQLPVRVRPHPRRAPHPRVMKLLSQRKVRIDRSPSLSVALDGCKAVACINSSGAVEALDRHFPVLCYGNAIYRHEGVVYCLTNEANQTVSVTQSLRDNRMELSTERVEAMVARITSRQWQINDIPSRLPDLLAATLSPVSADVSPAACNRHDLLSRAMGAVTAWRRAA